MDGYAAIAQVYDDWQTRYGSFAEQTLAALEPRLLASHPPVTSFLDLGCGTGSLLLGLATRHPTWRLCGLDGSAAMLAQARRKPGATRIHWLEARLGLDTPLTDQPFDAAGAFFNTFNHLTDADALARAFIATSALLRQGGHLYFDLNDELAYELWWREPRRYEGPGWVVEMEHAWDPAHLTARADILVSTDRGVARTQVIERCHAHESVAAGLAHAGFVLETVEPWAPGPSDPPAISFWTARRR